MKTRLTFPTQVLLLFLCITGLPIVAVSQDAEKQKIIDVINAEIDYWYKKDRTNWASQVVQSNDFAMTFASPDGYYSVQRFDSLLAQREKYFSTPVDPTVKRISKSDFKVNIKGPIAIVDLTHKGENFFGPFTADQMILMEKQGKSWKILRQNSVARSSYELNDSNVEAGLNTQGYKLIQLKKLEEAIKVFTLNTQLFPNAYNTWDSLAEAYMEKGEKDIAIGFYKKSLELNATNDNATKMIEKLSQK
jgi:tetratricopeptide (TPR) repeat protein